METHTDESRAADAKLNALFEADANKQPADANKQPASRSEDDKRAARIADLAAESLDKADALQACLGASTAGMLQIDQTLQERIIRALGADSGALTDTAAILPALDAALRLERQAERYGQFSLKLQSIDQKIKSDKSALQSQALSGFVNQVTSRKSQLPSHWRP